MSSFPPKQWRVRFLADLDTMEGTVYEDRPISIEALMAVRPSGGEEGAYRFTLAGPEHLKLRIKVSDVLDHGAFQGMYLDIQMEIGTQVNTQKYIIQINGILLIQYIVEYTVKYRIQHTNV